MSALTPMLTFGGKPDDLFDGVRLVAEGCCNKTVARKLAIAPDTVKGHMKAIFQKLEANNRTQAAAVAERRGLLKPPVAR